MQTELMTFNVVDEAGETALETVAVHHVADSGYDLISITQPEIDGSGDTITVLIHREQLVALANLLRGH